MLRLKSALIALLWACIPALGAQVNITIDDTTGDEVTGVKPIFSPSTRGLWKDQTCIDCLINPDVRLTVRNTYTAATYIPELGKMSISLRFNGTAIYVFFILVNSADPRVIPETECSFVLDNGPPLPFRYPSDRTSTGYKYNQLVYSNTGLPAGDHSLEIVTDNLDYRVYVNFDYALYTHDDGTTSNASQGNTPTDQSGTQQSKAASSGLSKGARIGVIVASVLGSILLLLVGAFMFLRYRRSRPEKEEQYVAPLPVGGITPFSDHDWDYYPQSNFQNPSITSSQSKVVMQEAPAGRMVTLTTETKRGVHLTVNGQAEAEEQERVRQARQAEINERLRALQQEMGQLRASSGGRQQDSDSSVHAVTEMREQMAQMNQEIEALRENRRSEWAMGLTNEPPPGYTTMSIASPNAADRVQ
ncbi:hypothetical protein MD484_g5174, partial [Candolleomyces efflorescens]